MQNRKTMYIVKRRNNIVFDNSPADSWPKYFGKTNPVGLKRLMEVEEINDVFNVIAHWNFHSAKDL